MRHFWNKDEQVVQRLANEHLGSVPEMSAEDAQRVQAIVQALADNLSMRRCLAAVHAVGIACSRRQMKPFRDAEISGAWAKNHGTQRCYVNAQRQASA